MFTDITEVINPQDHRVTFTATNQEGVSHTKTGNFVEQTMSKDYYKSIANERTLDT